MGIFDTEFEVEQGDEVIIHLTDGTTVDGQMGQDLNSDHDGPWIKIQAPKQALLINVHHIMTVTLKKKYEPII